MVSDIFSTAAGVTVSNHLQFFCHSLPLSFAVDERQLMFFSKLQHTDNHILHILMHLLMVKYEMLGLAAKYGLRVRCLILDMLFGPVLHRESSFSFFLGFSSCVVLFFLMFL